MRRLATIAGALLFAGASTLVGAGGCAAGAQPTACFSSSGCPVGAQCVLGECTTSPRAFPVDLDVQPLPASGYLPQPVTGVPPQATGEVDVVVPQPVTVQVNAPDPVRVTFDAEGDLRHPLSYTTEVVQSQPGVTASGSVNLVAGTLDGRTGHLEPLTWDAVVVPTTAGCCDGTGPCTAPVLVKSLLLGADTSWVPPLPTSVIRITGKVVASQASWTPIENLQVQAFDPVTGIFTLPAKTDATGAFCLAVAPPPAGQSWHLTLRLGPSDTRPTVDVTGIDVKAGGGDLDLGAVEIGDHGAPLPPLQGQVLASDGRTPIQAARVTFVGQVDPKGTFSASVTTDLHGRFSVTLLRGLYDVRAEPPADSPDGPATLTGFDPTTLAVGESLDLTADARPVVEGKVLAPGTGGAASPLAGVEVVAEPDPKASATPPPQSFTTVTDAHGVYHLAVDPGAYQVRFVPPADSGLPWAVGRALSVTADRLVETVTLEQPAVLPGKVLGRTGGSTVPLSGAKVEVYGHAPSGRAVLLWRGRAGDGGRFEVRLPQSLAGRLTGG